MLHGSQYETLSDRSSASLARTGTNTKETAVGRSRKPGKPSCDTLGLRQALTSEARPQTRRQEELHRQPLTAEQQHFLLSCVGKVGLNPTMQVETCLYRIRAADNRAELLHSSPDRSSAVAPDMMHQSDIKIYNVTDPERAFAHTLIWLELQIKAKRFLARCWVSPHGLEELYARASLPYHHVKHTRLLLHHGRSPEPPLLPLGGLEHLQLRICGRDRESISVFFFFPVF